MTTAHQLLLIGKAGPIADALLAVLAATPGVEVSARLDKVPNRGDREDPCAVLLECGSLEREVRAAVRAVRRLWPAARCLVLADDVRQQDEARAAGADAALIHGCPPAELIATVQALVA